MDILSSLSNLATQAAKLTLPGALAALGFALLLWPPNTVDRIPRAISYNLTIDTQLLNPGEIASPADLSTDQAIQLYLRNAKPACAVKDAVDSGEHLANSPTLSLARAWAVQNQLVLEDKDKRLQKCIEDEKALQGVEDTVIANLGLLIKARTDERDGINKLYQAYIQSLSPMRTHYEQLLEDKEAEILRLQTHLINFQRIKSERDRRVAQWMRLDTDINKLLQEPGRLRPKQKFDDIVSGFGSHIIGLAALAIAWSLLLDPVTQALFSYIYDSGFDDRWDAARPARQSVGQVAFDYEESKRKSSTSELE